MADAIDASDKGAMRALLKRVRATAAEADPSAGEALAARFSAKLIERFGEVTSFYWPIGSEIDPRPLARKMIDEGRTLALPRVEGDGALTFRQWQPGDELEPRRFGLWEPLETAISVRPTLILVPLLGVDMLGNRLGYGQGHFDRTISALRADGPVFACGLAYEAQIVEHVPAEPHDIPLDWLVTETENHPLFLSRTVRRH